MVNVNASAVTNTEAVNRIVLDVDVMNRAGSKDFAELDEVVRPFMWSVIDQLYRTTVLTSPRRHCYQVHPTRLRHCHQELRPQQL
jgi:hypothetical protein